MYLFMGEKHVKRGTFPEVLFSQIALRSAQETRNNQETWSTNIEILNVYEKTNLSLDHETNMNYHNFYAANWWQTALY